MIYVTLNDGTEIQYLNFDEIIHDDEIIELNCSDNQLRE
jgi:hypothetical protein